MPIVQTTIGTGNGAATAPANFHQSLAGNLQPLPMQGGQGAMQLVPAGSTNGTPLGTMPEGGVGAQLYLSAGQSITYTIQASQPTNAPAATYTLTGGSGGNASEAFEPLCSGAMLYIVGPVTGTPVFRFI